MATPTIPMWAQVSDDLWVATLGAVHLGRVEQQGAQFVAVDHLNASIGSYADNQRARAAVAARSEQAVAHFESGVITPVRTGPSRAFVTVLVAIGVLVVAAVPVTVALVA